MTAVAAPITDVNTATSGGPNVRYVVVSAILRKFVAPFLTRDADQSVPQAHSEQTGGLSQGTIILLVQTFPVCILVV